MSRAREIADRDLAATELILDGDNDSSITADTDDQIDIKVGGTDTVVIKPDEMILQGPHPSFTLTDSDDTNGGGVFYNNGTLSVAADTGNTGATGKLSFQIDGNEDVTIDGGGDLTIADGNLVIGTSGHGISFAATSDGFATNGSELLADYERGAYTLSTNGFVYQTVSQGIYTRVGDLCFFYFFIHASGSQNGNTFTCSLPFTVAANNASSNSGYYSNAVAPVMHYRVDTGTAGMVAYVVAGTNYLKLYTIDEDGDWGQMTNANFTNEDQAHISGVFMCDPA